MAVEFIPIPFERLHFYMRHDPFYGIEKEPEKSDKGNFVLTDQGAKDLPDIQLVIQQIREQYGNLESHREIEERYPNLPCKSDSQRYLLLLLCGVLGLTATRENQPLQWRARDFLKNWTGRFDVNLVHFRDLLRKHNWPLPVHLFADAKDNTQRKLALSEEEYEAEAKAFNEILPELEAILGELRAVQPENMAARRTKEREVRRIERRILAIRMNSRDYRDETPAERKERLHTWHAEELKKGQRGALTRTARREGIRPQTLSGILKR